MKTILYHVTFAPKKQKAFEPSENFVAVVNAIENNDTYYAYHFIDGKHLTPDYAAIRDAIIHQHRKAFDKASCWFPASLHSNVSGILDSLNSMKIELHDYKNNYIGTIYATPYLA